MEVALCQPCLGHRRPLGETVKVVLRPNVEATELAVAIARREHWDRVTAHVGEIIEPYDARRRLVIERED